MRDVHTQQREIQKASAESIRLKSTVSINVGDLVDQNLWRLRNRCSTPSAGSGRTPLAAVQ